MRKLFVFTLMVAIFAGCVKKDTSNLTPCKKKCVERLESCAASFRENSQMTCEMMQTQCNAGCDQFR